MGGAVGEGVGVLVGDGDAVGVGVLLGEGDGDGVLVGDGEGGVGVRVGDGDGVLDGDGLGAVGLTTSLQCSNFAGSPAAEIVMLPTYVPFPKPAFGLTFKNVPFPMPDGLSVLSHVIESSAPQEALVDVLIQTKRGVG